MITNKIPKALINDFRDNNVVLFIGSGLSINANLPAWGELINHLVHDVIILNKNDKQYFDGLDILSKAQFLVDKIGKPALIKAIVNIFNQTEILGHSEVHKLLVELPVSTIITTNWDTLIEDSYSKYSNKRIQTIWHDNQIKTLKDSEIQIIKYHGTLEQFDSIVFSEEDYYKNALSDSLIKSKIISSLSDKTFLFIGYSLNDFNLKQLLYFVKIKLNNLNPRGYYFQPEYNISEVDYLTRRGLTVIPFNAVSAEKSTINFLFELRNQVRKSAQSELERLKIIFRESTRVLRNADRVVIRNKSNLGPLATPLNSKNKDIFGYSEITYWEVKCARNWQELIKQGAKAKCIICLDEKWLKYKSSNENLKLRLNTLKSNIQKFGNLIEIVDCGSMTDTNIEIYGNEVCLISKKSKYEMKSYNEIEVISDSFNVRNEVDRFDSIFNSLMEFNKSMINVNVPSVNEVIIKKLEHLIRNC